MSEYNLDFSKKLIDAARVVLNDGIDSFDAQRTVLYLSLLSSEITLKALLEKAGMSIKEIKEHSHNIDSLMVSLGDCEVEEDIGTNVLKWVPASRLRSEVVSTDTGTTTVGKFLSAESCGASKYPNQIRYGNHLVHYPPETALEASAVILSYVRNHWDRVRLSSKTP